MVDSLRVLSTVIRRPGVTSRVVTVTVPPAAAIIAGPQPTVQ